MVRSFANFDKSKWDENLVHFEAAYNSSIHAATSFSPFFLNYGVETRILRYGGKPGLFIVFCLMRIADDNNGRITSPSRGRGRGGVVILHFQSHHMNHHQGGPPSTPHQAKIAKASAAFEVPPPPPYYQDNHHVCIARFKSKVATVSETKTDDSSIESGATYHFFRLRESFKTYGEIDAEFVSTASGSTRFVGKGTVILPIGKVVKVEAFHAPDLTSNIIANHHLSELLNLLYT